MHLPWRVRKKEQWNSRFQVALQRQEGLYCSGQKTSLATGESAMVIRKKIVKHQEEGKSRVPVTSLKRMVTIPRKFNMNHHQFHLISETGKKM